MVLGLLVLPVEAHRAHYNDKHKNEGICEVQVVGTEKRARKAKAEAQDEKTQNFGFLLGHFLFSIGEDSIGLCYYSFYFGHHIMAELAFNLKALTDVEHELARALSSANYDCLLSLHGNSNTLVG